LTCTWTCAGAGGGTCTAAGSGNIGDTVNLPAGGSVTYTASCTISASATGTLSNTATVTAPGGVTDPTPGNNSATDTDTLAAQADISVTKVDSPDPVVAGTDLTYTITVTNAGPSNADSAAITDNLPAGTTFVSISAPGDWMCAMPSVGMGGQVGCSNPSLGVGSAVFTLTVKVDATVPDETVISNTVDLLSGTTDPNPGDTSATATTTVLFETGDYFTVTPCRLLDTRTTLGGAFTDGTVEVVPIQGVCGIPATAKAVSLNVTAVGPTGEGFLVLYPSDQARPGTSNVNYEPGQIRSNNALVRLGADGAIKVFPQVLPGAGSVDVVIDVVGYFE
jgi:uncharacterized repeat protein (TIGR01451 family)